MVLHIYARLTRGLVFFHLAIPFLASPNGQSIEWFHSGVHEDVDRRRSSFRQVAHGNASAASVIGHCAVL